MIKTLVLTSIVGGKDQLKDPETAYPNCQYIALVDVINLEIKIWTQHLITEYSCIDQFHARRNAKLHKILTFATPANYIIWVDGTHSLNIDPLEIYKEYGDFDYLVFEHPQRRCVYQEFAAVKGMDNDVTIEEQKKAYLHANFPKMYGMYELGCNIRKVNPKTFQFGLIWFEQVCKYSSRDQLSFPFVKWLMRDTINIKTMEGNCSQYLGTPFENDGNKYFINHSNHLK